MIDYVRSFLLKHLSISRLTSRRSLCLPVAKSIAIASSFQRSNEPLRESHSQYQKSGLP